MILDAEAPSTVRARRGAPDVASASACLRLTTPRVRLAYPADAEAHFGEVQRALAPWAQKKGHRPHSAAKYHGPWVENVWISHFERELRRHLVIARLIARAALAQCRAHCMGRGA